MKGINRIVRFPWALALVAASAHTGAQTPPLEELAAAPDLMQLAYIKASNAEAYDHFGCGGANTGHSGNSVAISRDGATLAIGAPYESSGTTGIDGDGTEESESDSGAVYVFGRR